MIRIIVEFTKVIILIIIGLLMNSCAKFESNFQSVSGNGNVVTVNRTITEPFTAIKAKTGLEVIVKQGEDKKVVIEADDNLHDIISYNVLGKTLKLTALKQPVGEKNFRHPDGLDIPVRSTEA